MSLQFFFVTLRICFRKVAPTKRQPARRHKQQSRYLRCHFHKAMCAIFLRLHLCQWTVRLLATGCLLLHHCRLFTSCSRHVLVRRAVVVDMAQQAGLCVVVLMPQDAVGAVDVLLPQATGVAGIRLFSMTQLRYQGRTMRTRLKILRPTTTGASSTTMPYLRLRLSMASAGLQTICLLAMGRWHRMSLTKENLKPKRRDACQRCCRRYSRSASTATTAELCLLRDCFREFRISSVRTHGTTTLATRAVPLLASSTTMSSSRQRLLRGCRTTTSSCASRVSLQAMETLQTSRCDKLLACRCACLCELLRFAYILKCAAHYTGRWPS